MIRIRSLVRRCPGRHTKGDLYPKYEDMERVEMLAIENPSESFISGFVNPVLEQVNDALLTLSESRYVLIVRGYGILQTPFSKKLMCTFSGSGIDSIYARYQAYGQEDQVRLYGGDIVARIESAVLGSRFATHDGVLSDIDPIKFGVNEKEPFLLFERAVSPRV